MNLYDEVLICWHVPRRGIYWPLIYPKMTNMTKTSAQNPIDEPRREVAQHRVSRHDSGAYDSELSDLMPCTRESYQPDPKILACANRRTCTGEDKESGMVDNSVCSQVRF